MGQPRRWLIAYDIADRRRLQRTHKLLSGRALALQKSVFLFRGGQEQAEQLREELAAQLNPREDDLRLYPLPANGRIIALGRTALPEDIFLTGYEEDILSNDMVA